MSYQPKEQRNPMTISHYNFRSNVNSTRISRHFTFAGLIAGLLFLLFSEDSARADRSPTNCTGSGLGISLYTSIPDVHIGDTLSYSVNVFNGSAGSPAIACDASSITAFIVTPDGVTNNVTLIRTALVQGQADFYSNVVS